MIDANGTGEETSYFVLRSSAVRINSRRLLQRGKARRRISHSRNSRDYHYRYESKREERVVNATWNEMTIRMSGTLLCCPDLSLCNSYGKPYGLECWNFQRQKAYALFTFYWPTFGMPWNIFETLEIRSLIIFVQVTDLVSYSRSRTSRK